MVNCGRYGAELPEGARFCPRCGDRVGEVMKEEFSVSAGDLVGKVKELFHEGNVTRIIIRDEGGKTLLEVPATVGVVGVILTPWLWNAQ